MFLKLMAVGFLVLGALDFVPAAQFLARGVPAVGEITAVYDRPNSTWIQSRYHGLKYLYSDVTYVTIAFTDRQGRRQVFDAPEADCGNFDPGHVPVLYLASNPSSAVVDSFFALLARAAVFIGIGCAILIFARWIR